MPTYDYECTACGHAFQAFHGITADPIRQCPECKKQKVERLIGSGSGIIFKGSGFYTTDYRSKEYKEKARKEASGSSDGGGTDSSGSSGSSKGSKTKDASTGKGKESKSSSDKGA